MVTRTQAMEAKELAFLKGIAAQHPRNNLPPIVSPFVGVFQTLLRRTTGLSLLCLCGVAAGLAYLHTASAFSIYIPRWLLLVLLLLLIVLGITPFLGYKGAASANWSYLTLFERALAGFLVGLCLGIYALELFHHDMENALMTYSNETHAYTVYRPSLFLNDSDATPPLNITSFVQAEFGKVLLEFLQGQFETMFPQNSNSNTTSGSHAMSLPTILAPTNATTDDHAFAITDPLPWLSYQANALLNPPPVTETPEWMKTWVHDVCLPALPVNASYLDGNVVVPMDPTFASCLRPILSMLVDATYVLQVALLSLSALLLLEWTALLLLKWLDPTCPTTAIATATKKVAASSGSVVHLLHVLLILFGLCALGVSAALLYTVALDVSSMHGRPIDTSHIIVWSLTGAFLVYSMSVTVAGLLGCSPRFRRAQTRALLLTFLLQSVSIAVLYVVHTDTKTIIRQDLHDDGRWHQVYVHALLQYILDGFQRSHSTVLLDFLENECQLSMTTIDDMSDTCKLTVATMLNEYVHGFLCVFIGLWGIELALFFKNVYVLYLRAWGRRLLGKKPGEKRARKLKPHATSHVSESLKEASLPFASALTLYLHSVPAGGNANAAKHAFTSEWLSRTGASSVHDSEMVLTSEFESIVRVLVLERLVTVCGLEVSVSISKDGKKMYLKLSASRRLVAMEAERRKYKLPFQDAVDPGPTFWTPREVATDRRVYDPQTAKQKLCSLYGRNLLLATENQFFAHESLAQIARRINVHQRAADLADDPPLPPGQTKTKKKIVKKPARVPYMYPTYGAYYKKPSLQYLYKRHPNQLDLPTVETSPSVFQTTDILRLVDRIVQDEIDTTAMVDAGVLEAYSCLHAASRFEWTNLESLKTQWLTYWRPRQLPGEPDPDTAYFRNFFYRIYPFRQPLTAVREYYGEQIALYFLWLGFYAQCLLLPVVFSLVYIIVWHKGDYHGYATYVATTTNGTSHIECTLDATYLGLCILLWAFGYAKLWQRKQHLTTVAWGMDGYVEEQQVRPAFYGISEQRNPITNEIERFFPTHRRVQLQAVSLAVIAAVLWGYYLVMVSLYSLQPTFVRVAGPFYGTTLVSICQVGVVNLCAKHTSRMAYWLTEKENYMTQSEYEANVVLKIFLMQGSIFYSALLFTAFLKHQTLGCYDVSTMVFGSPSTTSALDYGPTSNCLPEVENLLLCLFLYRMGKNALQIALPLLRYLRSLGTKVDDEGIDDVEAELALAPLENLYEDYAEIVVQFGLLTLFIFVAPIAPILAFLESAIQLRLDAFHLCCTMRRPLPMEAEDIGTWFTYIMLLSRLCILTNLGFLFFAASNFADFAPHERMTMYLLCVALGLVLFECAWLAVPGEPALKQELLARHDFVRQKYFFAPSAASNALTPEKPLTTTSELMASVQAYSADTLHALHARAELLDKFNHLFAPISTTTTTVPSSPPLGTASADDLRDTNSLQRTSSVALAPLDLSGIDAIREAVRRSEESFLDDDAPDWYFAPTRRAPPPWSRRESSLQRHRSNALSFMDEEANEEASACDDNEDDDPYVFEDDDDDLVDLM
ncbi:hypothetical protein SPRG_19347 [Saprolegnia parasitica CBS 223.65]|uniref:Anoctamin transmembrane domain-containing protein n=1 Tax=Saprolegnia parasitica (strain CBS 223.65) TaxID=695850 RepID=A0A067D4X8_SAPPC|nr:hypothetical protein SPRG_19347 [Saprolegnia parasitica CBS 223.65]KDO33741.1 hypothetical protein SPRG_19347 [Saprolegnia parasitica CBS 223.65]|eukprot:XP_012195756.1 hypothetical protein SPRG_19347 [Saprolegnia parasitica CBS 223.65]